jgi:hypothetical protein
MGLDITGYSKLKLECEYDQEKYENDDYDWRTVTLLHPDLLEQTVKEFPGRCEDMKPGFYSYDDGHGFKAGSYRGYNLWRAWLSKAMLDAAPETVWEREEDFKGKPFFEIISFPDNEGVIGTEVCKRVSQAFKDNRERALAADSGGGWNLNLYDDWTKAFALGADGGCVKFH